MLKYMNSHLAETSKMELFVITVNGFQLLTIIKKCSILDVATVLEPSELLCKKDILQNVTNSSAVESFFS